MSSTNLIVYALVVFVGLRAVWQGVRGLRGEIGVRYGLLTGLLVKQLAPEDKGETDETVLKVGSIMRLIIGLIITAMGAYLLYVELT